MKAAIQPGDIVSHAEMSVAEGVHLQRGMNFHLRGCLSVLLMSVRKGAPYEDEIREEGRILIYEGHDAPKSKGAPDPKTVDQPEYSPHGKPSQNKLFYDAASLFKKGEGQAELVRVYEKIRDGIWTFVGLFRLVDAWKEQRHGRAVFRYRLELSRGGAEPGPTKSDLRHDRMIPSAVKREVWKRDRGQCVKCGSKKNLHFDHDYPFSRGGTSLLAENIRLLCAKHNLEKKDRIE